MQQPNNYFTQGGVSIVVQFIVGKYFCQTQMSPGGFNEQNKDLYFYSFF